MYIPDIIIGFFLMTIFLMVFFIVTLVWKRQILWIHRFYFGATILLIIWMLAIISIRFTDPADIRSLMGLDSVTTACAAMIPPCSLLFSICYTKNYVSKLPGRCWLLFIVPVLTTIMVATNQRHHLYYRVFSLENTTVRFGPYFAVHSIYTFSCVAISVFLIIRFAARTRMRIHMRQAALFTVGSIFPSIMNVLVVGNVIKATIVVTPISFIVTIFLHGIIIYHFHFFDIKPLAIQELIKWIEDSYLVTNQSGLIISYNRPFWDLLGNQYGIRENMPLENCVRNSDVQNKTAVFNLMTALNSCSASNEKVTYEETIEREAQGETRKEYYMVEVTPLTVKGTVCGFLSILKDVTSIKVNMQKLQESRVKMMERERLAFLGQMVGGLAHNLKTPIMSISGSVSAVEDLTRECRQSIGDPAVTADDYTEIYTEMDSWLERMRDACAYMSDIISAVKGQAGSMNAAVKTDFSLDDALKRVSLLLRHELIQNSCSLVISYPFDRQDILIHGDINCLVQVLNNLVSNAIDAQLPEGNHEISFGIREEDEQLKLSVTDHGGGIAPNVKKKLFQEMVTSKGARGTGLGIFVSNTIIHANFDGSMWFTDNPGGGTIWGVSLPLGIVRFIEKKDEENEKA